MNPQEKYNLGHLILLSLEGGISEAEFKQLRQWIQSDSQAMAYYMEYTTLYSHLLSPENAQPEQEQDVLSDELWTSLAREERTAPTVEIEREEPEREPVRKVVYDKTPRQVNKFKLFTAVFSSAALLCVILLLNLTPGSPASEEVAVVQDVYKARWADPSLFLEQEDRLYTNKVLSLADGCIEIHTNSGVELTIEGPAEFEFSGQANLELNYGRIYARVSPRGIGFTVSTENCRIIDLGTEFGVFRDLSGQTELHVMKGQTTLVSGGSWLAKKSQTILQKQARQISADGSQVRQIPIAEEDFARSIDSQTGTVWHGQLQLNLADMVGGGNGLGTGKTEFGIDPGTGKEVVLSPQVTNRHPRAANTYRPFPANPFIDGVFVPDSEPGPQVISSTGYTFSDFPMTRGDYYIGVINGTDTDFMVAANDPANGGPGLALNGTAYGTAQNPAIFMHASQGITFDLDAVRRNYGELDLARFESMCGISQTAPSFYSGMANIYVLVDGVPRFRQEDIRRGQAFFVNIDLKEGDRFLTLITTVADQTDWSDEYPVAGDWCMFGKPVLTAVYKNL